jgi:Ion channel
MDAGHTNLPAQAHWVRRAERVSDAFGLVLILVLVTYVLASLLANQGWPAVLVMLATSATAIVALTSSHTRATVVRRAIAIAVVAVALATISAVVGGQGGLNAASFLVICLLAVSMGAVLRRVVTSREVSSRTILGAISVYTSLGILFTWAYGTIDRLEDGGFFGEVPTKGSDFLFFSYTTLTTTGYGDLVPAGQFGRMVSGLEMMLGQVFLVTLVAGLVSLWRPGEGLRRRREQRGGGDATAD